MDKPRMPSVNFCDWDDSTINDRAKIVLNRLMAKYGEPSCGKNRATFIGKNFVIKFPRSDSGINDNCIESSYSDDTTAKSRGFILDGFLCVVQERLVMPTKEQRKSMPSWVDFIDCGQVGFDRKGNLKAYDFA